MRRSLWRRLKGRNVSLVDGKDVWGRIVKAKQKDWRCRGKLTLVGFLRGFGALALDGLRDVGSGVPGDVGLAGYPE